MADFNNYAVIRVFPQSEKLVEAGEYRDLLPQQVSAELLQYVASELKNRFHQEQIHAVITVPGKSSIFRRDSSDTANFDDNQKRATIEAAKIAGIEVERLVHEPTAAAVSYLHGQSTFKEGHYMVFDFGGGTLDVSVVEMKGPNIFEVLMV